MSSSSNLKLDSLDPEETKTLLNALLSLKKGDFNVRLPSDWIGLPGKIAKTFNTVIETAEGQNKEFTQNKEVESKNGEVGQARKSSTEKAEQSALTSKYNSEFLANKSHDLRTSLNSLLLLSKQLSENRANHLSKNEVECAQNIYLSAVDLLNLTNDIFDLAQNYEGYEKNAIFDDDSQKNQKTDKILEKTVKKKAKSNKNRNIQIREEPQETSVPEISRGSRMITQAL